MLRDITNIIGHPVVLIAALLLGCYLFFFSGYNDAGPRTVLKERNERNERNERAFTPPNTINYVD
ncbi:MAG: hypothetical protein OEU95_09525, partial [Nitrospirota bacterium]|nr:hypothetical protein [Nitrospirota bacterium]